MMKKLLPAPLLTACIIAIWLVLNQSLQLADWVLAILLGVLLPAWLSPLRPSVPRIRHPWSIVRLIAVVAHDVVASNLMVFHTIVRGRKKPPHSGFVRIPLDLRDPHAIASLAVITTTIPGTVWCELARDNSSFLLHVWHAPDPQAFALAYKERYEKPLMRIFES